MKHNEETKRLRRQVEDYLRKGPATQVHKVALLLGLGCTSDGHPYAEKVCPKCGATFCYACCGGTNVDQGGKHEPDVMLCPVCGHDYYAG